MLENPFRLLLKTGGLDLITTPVVKVLTKRRRQIGTMVTKLSSGTADASHPASLHDLTSFT